MMNLKATLLASALLFASAPFAQAQEDSQQEMKELFAKVERRLREIDELLSNASSGDTSGLSSIGESGIDELLKRSQAGSKEVIEGIDRILEIAQESGPSSSGQGQSGDPQQGQSQPGGSEPSPLDQQGQQTLPRESTPSSPQQQQGGQEQEQQEGGQEPQPDSEPSDSRQMPNSPDGKPDPNQENFTGQDPPPLATDSPSSSLDSGDRWGSLPRHAQDVFRSEGGLELPAEYRDWIDAYYRRLNRDER